MTDKAVSSERAAAPKLGALNVAVRIAAATLGGYAVAYSLTAALAGAMFKLAHADRVDTAIISTNLAVVLFVAQVIWTFAERRLWRVVAVPVVATAVLAAVAWSLRL